MRVAVVGLALAFLAPAAGCGRSPEGVSRLLTGESYFRRHFPKARLVLFVDGEYPRKTKLGVLDLETGKARAFHLAGYRVSRAFAALSRDAALVNATATDEKGGSQLLLVSLADGVINRRVADTSGADWCELARPAWTSRAFLLKSAGGQAFLSAFDPASGVLEEPKTVGDFVVRRAAFADKTPVLLLAAEQGGAPVLVTYDLLAAKVVRSEPSTGGLTCLQPVDAGAIACRRVPGTNRTALEQIDAANDLVKTIGTIEGELESLVQADRRVLAVAKDTLAPASADPRFAARRLTVFPADGSAVETIPWTKRGEALFGRDATSGRLLFAATEPMSLWAIDDRPGAWPAAVGELDRRAGELWTREASYMMFAGLCILVFVGIVKASRPACKSCDS